MSQQPGQGGSNPQYSPDGKWWWDGQKWVAVGQAPQATGPTGGPAAAGRPRRRRAWPWVVGALAVLFLVVVIAAVASSPNSSQKTASTTSATTAPTHAATAAPTAKPAAAPAARDGSCSPQPCANDNYGWIVTVSNVRYGANGGQFEQPEAGNVFFMIDVTFTNKLDQEQHANPTEFVLQDGAGIKHTVRPLIEVSCGAWDPVNLTKGSALTKCISFEATAGKPAGLTLVWTPSGFGGGYNMKLS